MPSVIDYGDMMRLNFYVKAPDHPLVGTRAAHPQGKGIQKIDALCFDEDGKFLTSAEGVITNTDEENGESGRVTVVIPYKTRVMHLVCNLPDFDAKSFKGMTELEVFEEKLNEQENMVYWARVELQEKAEGFNANEENPIILLRNQAKITLESVSADEESDAWDGDYFVITGYILNHQFLTGTVAPLEPQYLRYPTYNSSEYGINDWLSEEYIHIPQNSVSVDLNDEAVQNMEVLTDREQFIFESANTTQVPLDIIVKGYNIVGGKKDSEKYYKVNLVDKDFQLISVRRNYHYKVAIEGNLFYGVNTLEEAILPTTPATNNVWIYIADEVTSVMSKDYMLSVDEYLVVLDSDQVSADSKLELAFEVEDINNDGGSDLNKFVPEVSWVEEQNVSTTEYLVAKVDKVSDVKLRGTIALQVVEAEDGQLLSGTVLIKYGPLQRKINVISMSVQDFDDLQMEVLPKGDDAAPTNYREKVQVKFNVPDSYPEGLYPFNVLVSTDAFSLIPQDGQKVSIVTEGEEGYGESFNEVIEGKEVYDPGYKYIVTITSPGEQTVVFQSVYTEKDQTDEKQFISFEADHFHRQTVLYSIL